MCGDSQRVSSRMYDVPDEGEGCALLAASVSIDGERAVFPVPRGLRGMSASRFIEEPSLLRRLINEQLERRRARHARLEQQRAERARMGRLHAATRTVRDDWWSRLTSQPISQRTFILTMSLVGLLLIGDGVDHLANYPPWRQAY